jgi:hypothetical protein
MVLLELVHNKHKALNATLLPLAAVQLKSDFFRLSDITGHRQPFRVVGRKKDFDTVIGLHPFHSTRRIDAHVAAKLNISISSFNLTVIEHSDRQSLPPNVALELLNLQDHLIEHSRVCPE